MLQTISHDSVIVDLACGAGDLLLACTPRLRRHPTLAQTLEDWATKLIGRDIHAEFVEAAKLRLILQAVRLGGFHGESVPPIARLFPQLTVASGLAADALQVPATHIVVNPPFVPVLAPSGCTWGTGSVTSAALFFETWLRRAPVGARVAAILPEVLRSGSRYRAWRRMIEGRCDVDQIQVLGQFAPDVDIDVFALHGRVREPAIASALTDWLKSEEVGTTRQRLGELFEISVGSLVPYREPRRGPWTPTVYPKGLPAWSIVREITVRRRFSGRTVVPPFVVVRRTSRPGDSGRAIATIIATDRAVAVENHLLVLVPRDGTLRTCRAAVDALRRPETDAWLDRRIRCRHLTVPAMAEVPFDRG